MHKGSDYFLVVEANLEEDEENIRQQYKKYVLPPISTPSPSPPPPPQVRPDSDELFQHELILWYEILSSKYIPDISFLKFLVGFIWLFCKWH